MAAMIGFGLLSILASVSAQVGVRLGTSCICMTGGGFRFPVSASDLGA